jgi:Tfp pilus assembly protein PilX
MIVLNKKGTALLMTILILNSILMISLAASKLIFSGVRMSGTEAKSTKAYFAAEAGAEKILWEFRQGAGACKASETNCHFSKSLPNNSSYQTDYISGSQNVGSTLIFVSVGAFSGLKRSVELDFRY